MNNTGQGSTEMPNHTILNASAEAQERLEQLKALLRDLGSVAVAYSGGVDSTFLLAVAHEVLGYDALAVTSAGRSAPARDIERTRAFCSEHGIRQEVIFYDELAIPGFRENPKDRCYHCKKALFTQMAEAAQRRDAEHLVDGSNKDDEGDYRPGILNLIDLANIDQAEFAFGVVSAMCGKAAFEYIKKSIEITMAGEADAVATTPINKESLHAAEVPFIGHTEIFGALTGTPDPLTMFETNGLRVFFLTRHKSLRDMLDDITKDNIKACVKESLAALKRLGVTEGTMAIAGLNPHCGEHGLFGWEEVNEITPAVEELKAEGYPVVGPIGADSVFHQAAIGRYNSVLSLYHDQGHIATKTLDFERTISITNGMPILRTSVDHGTAFDIAGKGIVSEVSMAEAILLAAKYAPFFAGYTDKVNDLRVCRTVWCGRPLFS